MGFARRSGTRTSPAQTFALIAAFTVACSSLVGCSSEPEERIPAPVHYYSVENDGLQLVIGVDADLLKPDTKIELTEDSTSVIVTATHPKLPEGTQTNMEAGAFELPLKEPLGNRSVIDASTGLKIEYLE